MEVLEIFNTLFSIGERFVTIFGNIWNVINDWLLSTTGLSIENIAVALFKALINILEFILDLIENLSKK